LLVDYGKIASKLVGFKLGTLLVRINNYTEKVKIGGVKKFRVGVESRWNNEIKNVFGIVSFKNSTSVFSQFKTPSTNLRPWKKETLVAFFDSSNFSLGRKETNITIMYSGEAAEKIVEVEFIKGVDYFLILLIVVSVIGVAGTVVGIIFVIKMYKKNEK
jgi:hypothetical protein